MELTEDKKGFKKIGFSFCRYFNKQKKIGYPTLFEYQLPAESVLKWTDFLRWVESHGVSHDKIAYPAYFPSRAGVCYMGMLAIENIGPNEVIVQVPSSIIITTKVAYFSELNLIFKENPKLFAESLNPRYWEDQIMISFILYEKQKGENSFWYPYIRILPEHCDCLLNWDDEEIDEVQDKILIADAQKEFQEISQCWAEFYGCLKKYPKYFNEETISFAQFKWAYILIYTRLFTGAYGESAMVPFADCVNHENVDVSYDQIFSGTTVKEQKIEEDKEEYYGNSSGCDSDLSNEDNLTKNKIREPREEQFEKENLEEQKAPPTTTDPFQELEKKFAGQSSNYTFVLKTNKESFAKGSQVYLTYGKLSNRELLLHYGFSLEKNKYNYGFFKMGFRGEDPDPRKMQLFYEAFPKSDPHKGILSRKFKIFYQQFNCSILKFIKILSSKPEDLKEAILGAKSIEKERLALLHLIEVYKQFLKQLGTTLEEDEKLLNNDKASMSHRKYFALKYRIELKKIVHNQIRLCKIAVIILGRLEAGIDFNLACAKVPDFEQDKEEGMASIKGE